MEKNATKYSTVGSVGLALLYLAALADAIKWCWWMIKFFVSIPDHNDATVVVDDDNDNDADDNYGAK